MADSCKPWVIGYNRDLVPQDLVMKGEGLTPVSAKFLEGSGFEHR